MNWNKADTGIHEILHSDLKKSFHEQGIHLTLKHFADDGHHMYDKQK